MMKELNQLILLFPCSVPTNIYFLGKDKSRLWIQNFIGHFSFSYKKKKKKRGIHNRHMWKDFAIQTNAVLFRHEHYGPETVELLVTNIKLQTFYSALNKYIRKASQILPCTSSFQENRTFYPKDTKCYRIFLKIP